MKTTESVRALQLPSFVAEALVEQRSRQHAHPATMQAVAGHADPTITLAIYTHVGDVTKKAAAEAADRAFGRQAPD